MYETPPPPEPDARASFMSVSAPFVTTAVATALLLAQLGGRRGFARLVALGGDATVTVARVSSACTLATAAALFALARRTRVPAALLASCALAPWCLAMYSESVSLASLEGSLAHIADVASRREVLAHGLVEASAPALIGAWYSAALLASAALGAALGAPIPDVPQEAGWMGRIKLTAPMILATLLFALAASTPVAPSFRLFVALAGAAGIARAGWNASGGTWQAQQTVFASASLTALALIAASAIARPFGRLASMVTTPATVWPEVGPATTIRAWALVPMLVLLAAVQTQMLARVRPTRRGLVAAIAMVAVMALTLASQLRTERGAHDLANRYTTAALTAR